MAGKPPGSRIYTEDGLPVTPSNPLPVDVGTAAVTITVQNDLQIDSVTAADLVKPTTIKHYEVSTTTVGVWMPLTLTSLSYGYTIDARANTTTSAPPDFDFAMTNPFKVKIWHLIDNIIHSFCFKEIIS